MQLLGLMDHPNIVKYVESFDHENYFYIVMEYCSGGDLAAKITEMKERQTFINETVFRSILLISYF